MIELQRLKSGAGQQQQQQQPHVQSANSAPRQQQHEAQSMSPQHSSASVGPRPQQPGSAGGSWCAAACSEADAGRLLNLCCSLQRSVSCAESVQAALVEAISSSSAATSPTGTAPQHLQDQQGPASTGGRQQQQQQQARPLPVQPGTLAQVLGAELSVLKDTAVALSEQLQRFGSAADQLWASSQQQPQQQQPTSEFSFRPLQVVASQASISLDGDDTPAEGQRQQQLPLLGDSAGGAAAAGSTAATADGAVSVSPAVLQQLQAAAQQQQRRCAKWKSRCKQLAQQLTLLTAQWVAGQAQAAAATAAGTTDGTPAQQEEQQAAAAVAAADAGEQGGAGEAPSAQEVAAAVAAAAGMAALLSRLEEFEAQLDSRLQQSLGAAGALLTRGEGLAQDASAAANALEVRVQPLLGCAAGLEAQVAVLEQRLADAQQRHEAAVTEQAGALEGSCGPGWWGGCCVAMQTQGGGVERRVRSTVLGVGLCVCVCLVLVCLLLSALTVAFTDSAVPPSCPCVPCRCCPVAGSAGRAAVAAA